jgi:outer membrane protein TolC
MKGVFATFFLVGRQMGREAMNGLLIATFGRSHRAVKLCLIVSLIVASGCASSESHTVRNSSGASVAVPGGSQLIAKGWSAQETASGNDSAPPPEMRLVEPPSAERVIDLHLALGMAGIDNPTIARADEAVQVSLADQLQADALLLPTLDAGTSFNHHDGNLMSSRGLIRDVDRQSLYAGAGAVAVGTGTVIIPGVHLTAQLADAMYAPRAARQRVAERTYDAVSIRHQILLEVANGYFDLVRAEARLLATRQSANDLGEIARLTTNFAKTGQGRHGDADRSESELQLIRGNIQEAEADVGVSAANLARLLDLDPSIRLRAMPESISLIELVDPRKSLEELIQVALRERPEIQARTAEVGYQETRLRQEKVRPFVPFVSLEFSAGEFGGGSDQTDTRFGHFDGRTDLNLLAVWTLDNLGVGNLAVQRRVRAEVGQAEAERQRIVDQVRREVADALAAVSASKNEVALARGRVRTAAEGYRMDLARVRNLQGRPIEVLNSANLLYAARLDLIRAVTAFDQGQIQLFVALGQPPPVIDAVQTSEP